MKVIGNAQLAAAPAAVYAALHDPAVLVRTIPGCQRLEALGEDTYAMTVTAGVGSITGVYDGRVRLTDHDEPASFRLHADGAGAAGTIGAEVLVTLAESSDGTGTSLGYDADATVGGMIGGVGQRMLVGVAKRMAAEFFGNVEAALSAGPGAWRAEDGGPEPSGPPRPSDGPSPDPSTVAPPSGRPAPAPPPGAIYTAPRGARTSGEGPAFARGVAVGAVAALAGAVVGAWIGRRALR